MDKAATGRPHKRALMFLARNVLWLEFVAITMMAIGYWVDKAENYPFIAHLVAPKWAAANEGLTFLLAHKNSDPGPQGQLHADNPGFDELASICWEHLLEHNRHIRI